MIYNVFLHKIDAEMFVSDEKKNDALKIIKDGIRSELESLGVKVGNIEYHLTTVYDHSLIDAFSKVV